MMENVVFFRLEDVLFLHEHQLVKYGGGSGVRDIALLESALAQPSATFEDRFLHEDLFEMAAAYAFHIAQNQPFIDGNKRTGLLCAILFLKMNGQKVADPTERLCQAMFDIAERKLDKSGLAATFRELSHPIPHP